MIAPGSSASTPLPFAFVGLLKGQTHFCVSIPAGFSQTYRAMSSDDQSCDGNRKSAPAPGALDAEVKTPLFKVFLLALVVGLLLCLVYYSPVGGYLARIREVSDRIRSMGWLAPVVVTLGVALLVAAGFPRLLFCAIAGMALGFWHGLVWAQLGTLIGNYLIFLLVRAGGGEWGRRYLSNHGGFKLIESEGIAAVLLARQLPVPGLIVNLAFGLSKLKHRHFLIGTALGQLPEAIPCTLIGAGAIQSSFTKSAGMAGLAVLVMATLWIGLRMIGRRLKNKKLATLTGIEPVLPP